MQGSIYSGFLIGILGVQTMVHLSLGVLGLGDSFQQGVLSCRKVSSLCI